MLNGSHGAARPVTAVMQGVLNEMLRHFASCFKAAINKDITEKQEIRGCNILGNLHGHKHSPVLYIHTSTPYSDRAPTTIPPQTNLDHPEIQTHCPVHRPPYY
jgi:hypothetical protein